MNFILKHPLRFFPVPVPPIKRIPEPDNRGLSEETKRKLIELSISKTQSWEK